MGHMGFRVPRSQQGPGAPSLSPWGSQLVGVRMRVGDECTGDSEGSSLCPHPVTPGFCQESFRRLATPILSRCSWRLSRNSGRAESWDRDLMACKVENIHYLVLMENVC